MKVRNITSHTKIFTHSFGLGSGDAIHVNVSSGGLVDVKRDQLIEIILNRDNETWGVGDREALHTVLNEIKINYAHCSRYDVLLSPSDVRWRGCEWAYRHQDRPRDQKLARCPHFRKLNGMFDKYSIDPNNIVGIRCSPVSEGFLFR